MNIVKTGSVTCYCGCFVRGAVRSTTIRGKTPLVEVAGEYLYKEDLQAHFPFNISKDDSVLFAEHYIRNWVEDVLHF